MVCYGTLIYIETAALSAPRETPHHLERNKEMNCAKTAVASRKKHGQKKRSAPPLSSLNQNFLYCWTHGVLEPRSV